MKISTLIVLCVLAHLVIGAALALLHLLRADLDPNKDAFEKAAAYLLYWLPMLIAMPVFCFAVWAVGLPNRVRILREEQASITSAQKRVA
jgi:hypothetical protein